MLIMAAIIQLTLKVSGQQRKSVKLTPKCYKTTFEVIISKPSFNTEAALHDSHAKTDVRVNFHQLHSC